MRLTLLSFLLFVCVFAAAEDFPMTLEELGTKAEIRPDLMFEQVSADGKLFFTYNGKNPATVLDLQLSAGDTVEKGTFFLLLETESGKKVRVHMAQPVTVLQIRPLLGRYSTIKKGDILAVFRTSAAPEKKNILTPCQQAEKLLARINEEEDDAAAEEMTKRLLLLLQIAKKEGTPEEAGKALVMEFYVMTQKTGKLEENLKLLEQAAALNSGEALYLLGRYYKASDPAASAEFFRRALAENFPGAGIEYGFHCYRNGDKTKAKDAFHADALRGIASAQNLYGVMLLKEGQFEQGREWIGKAAAQKFAPALNNMGVFARTENTAESPAESARLFALAAEAGYAPAKRNLALAYWDGFGIKTDTVKAEQLAQEAANAGDSAAYYLLGMMALSGKERQEEKAFRYYLKAAESGYAPACLQVALMYRQGVGVKADDAQADRWLTRQEQLRNSKKDFPEEIEQKSKTE